ncbi:MAG TPA: RNA-binding protein [Bryobacteraceae bacterium]|nr:RNA-binding protein [Bryobacteraceae bacterium]
MKNIFVGSLSFNATEDDLREIFGQFGTVERASILMDRETGRSRGFGFVEMPNDNEAEAAIAALNGSTHLGRTLNVNEARPKGEGGGPPRGGGGGGFGGNRGGSGGGGGGGGRGRGGQQDDYRGQARQPREPRW